MKKILSRIFSVALIAATVASPTLAQTAKKAKAASTSQPKATVTMKAQTSAQKSKGAKGLNVLTMKTADNGIRQAFAKKVPGKRLAPLAEGAQLPDIYGSIVFNTDIANNTKEVGLYQIQKTADAESELLIAGVTANGGGVLIDGTYYCVNYFSFFGMVIVTASYYDVESGEKTASFDGDIDNIMIGGMAYDKATAMTYGVGYNAAGNGIQLSTVNFTDESINVTPICGLEENVNSIFFDNAGQLYAITYTGETQGESFVVTNSYLKKVDKATGAMTLVGETGYAPQYLSSAVVDPKTNKCYWNLCTADEKGYMCEVDLATGAASVLFELPLGDEIMGMQIPAPAAEDGAPAACENVTINFENDALVGKAHLTTPATLFDGTAGSGELIISVFANGEQMGYAEAGWGETIDVDVDLSLTGAGKYDFIVVASNEVGMGPKTKINNVWVGADTPEATTATLTYANGNMEVSWLPVTASVNGGYFDVDNLTYTVKRADGSVAAEGLTVTTFSEAVAEPAEITSYYYTVEAVCGELVSAPARTNTVVLGAIVPPYLCDFESGLSGWTILDANGDGKTWSESQGAVRVTYNSSEDMDDWLITPPVKLEAGKAYNVAFQAKSNGTSFPERIEVKYGKANTADAMTSTLVAATDLTTGDWEDFANMLVPDEDGTYYIGFHGISDADMFYLWLDNVQIEAGVSALAPGLASNLTATPDAAGALKCTVAFNAPDKTMNDQTLSSLTKVEVLRGETVVKTFDAPAPGAALSYEDVLTEGGDVIYTVIGYNEEGAGLKATVSAFVGFDLPADVESATIARTDVDGQVVVDWTPVTKDINGLTMPEGEVTYTIVKAEGGSLVEVASGLTGNSYTYQAVAAGEQDFVQVGVMAVNSAGQGGLAPTDMIPVGTPYNGISESFADTELHYIWGLNAIGNGDINIFTDEQFTDMSSQDGDNGFIGIKAQYLDEGADLMSGLVSLNQMENPGLVFYTYNIVGDAPDINEITVSVRELGQEEWTVVMGPKTVDDLCGGAEGWGRVSVSLAAYANKVVQVQITGITKQYVYTMLDNITVGSILGHDLAATTISAPGKVNAGENYTVDVKVANEGAQAAGAFSVELYADEDLVETKEVEGLAIGGATTVTFDRTMSALATEPVSYFAKVVYNEDENAENNQTSSLEVVPVVSNLPVATDLDASKVDNGVKLTWNEPNLEGGVPEQITDDFEDAESFAAEYGDWTFVDNDGSAVGGFQGSDIPGITPGTTTGSFWIFDNSAETWNQTFDAHSGNKYLFALFRYDDGTTDDWAISPELTGDAQTISFYARSYSTQYPEKLAVYYSTGSKETADFVEVEGSAVNSVPGEWTEYTAELPAGAKYFAIRSYATGSFMLMVDDVTYTPAGVTANLEIAGYNVYRDGVKINDAPVAECEYVDTNVVDGTQYTYVVTVVYTEKGESAASNEVVFTYEGGGVNSIGNGAVSIKAVNNTIVVLNAEGMNVVVASANGAVVYSGEGEAKTEVAVGSGVYVVTAGKTVKKVIVK